jgi:soluble lytic murein transglycosylase
MRFLLVIILLLCSFSSYGLEKFIEAIEQKKWNIAEKSSDKDLKILAKWLKLISDPNPDFYEVSSFIDHYPNWPKIELLKQKIEGLNCLACKNQDLIIWFKKNPPKSLIGKKKILSLSKDNQAKYVASIWEESIFSSKQEQDFYLQNTKLINKGQHLKRINYMLLNGYLEQANRVLKYLSGDLQLAYKIAINLQKGDKRFLSQYNKLQPAYKKNIVLMHSVAHFYEHNSDEANLINILKIISKNYDDFQFYFWRMKAKLIRPLISEKKYETAYLLASSHGHLDIKQYSEAEWLAGWIALRFLNKPDLAIKHFNNMYNKVKLPVSLARGSYWIARSHEALKNSEQAKNWYLVSSRYYTSFYGQLSICKINDCFLSLPGDPKEDEKSKNLFNNNILVKAAKVLNDSKYNHLVQEILFKAIENSNNQGEISLITKIGFELEKTHLSVEAAKHASYKSVYVNKSAYPVLKTIHQEHEVDEALIMSLIRQESVFNHRAVSSAGAMGLMQVMPFVAKNTATKNKIKFHSKKLINDPYFNTMIGIAHLDELLTRYSNSYILTIAAYNAGDVAVKRWIEDNNDPRVINNIDEIIDWLEKITYHETRNYVQRVLEGKSIYNILINKENKIFLTKDLR